jgi:hypothetical protein
MRPVGKPGDPPVRLGSSTACSNGSDKNRRSSEAGALSGPPASPQRWNVVLEPCFGGTARPCLFPVPVAANSSTLFQSRAPVDSS